MCLLLLLLLLMHQSTAELWHCHHIVPLIRIISVVLLRRLALNRYNGLHKMMVLLPLYNVVRAIAVGHLVVFRTVAIVAERHLCLATDTVAAVTATARDLHGIRTDVTGFHIASRGQQ